ncbi:hypothetical protein F511_11632 [Dorcoceras hygrometricum]|uniref:Uncharacterized protein n=1 Tax=Dorcoceras hygrometricum TaxID=472368 RepID=A0A2Z7AJZ8_9LAMI|nr:hypothetical protein F511_11632 [Dorcoceras hygrometricum]
MGPISNIGPKTPRAARDRPEQNLEAKFSRCNDAGDSPDGGRTAAAVANLACGVWPHAAAPSAALPISKSTKMGPISNIGPKTPRAARDRPEQNLEAKFSRCNDAGDSPDGGRTAAAVANLACGVWPHAAAPSAALPGSIVRQPWRTSGRPPRNIVAQPCVKRRTTMAQQLRKAAGSSPGHRVETTPSLWPMCAASAQRGVRGCLPRPATMCDQRAWRRTCNSVLLQVGFDWAVKMRIRPPELEPSICDAKYHFSLVGNIVMF